MAGSRCAGAAGRVGAVVHPPGVRHQYPGRHGDGAGRDPADAQASRGRDRQRDVERHPGSDAPAAAYTASKQATEGFTGSLAHELAHFNIRAKLVEPGYAPTTRFAQNGLVPVADLIPEAYADFAAPIFAAFARPALTTRETDVAAAIWAAVHDTAGQLRFPAGADAMALAKAK